MAMTFKTDLMPATAGGPYKLGNASKKWILNGITIPEASANTSLYLNGAGNWTAPPNTTYSSLTAAQNGTDVSLVTTGEKYAWNAKTSNAGTVTSVRV